MKLYPKVDWYKPKESVQLVSRARHLWGIGGISPITLHRLLWISPECWNTNQIAQLVIVAFTFHIHHMISTFQTRTRTNLWATYPQVNGTKNTQSLLADHQHCRSCRSAVLTLWLCFSLWPLPWRHGLNSSIPWKPFHSDQMFFLHKCLACESSACTSSLLDNRPSVDSSPPF